MSIEIKNPLRCKLCGETVVGVGYEAAIPHAREKHPQAMDGIAPESEAELEFCDRNFELAESTPPSSSINWEVIASSGYRVWWMHTRQSGREAKTWEELTAFERMPWIAAAQEICELFGKTVAV